MIRQDKNGQETEKAGAKLHFLLSVYDFLIRVGKGVGFLDWGRLQRKKSDYYFFWGGGVSEGHLSLFFGLKMIFKQF